MSVVGTRAAVTGHLAFTPGCILCYHGIRAPDDPMSANHVPLKVLTEAVRMARRLGNIVSLREIVERHLTGESTAGLFAFTFDDAYDSLLTRARPLIERERVPVTLFAVTDALRGGTAFWWDRLEEVERRASGEQWRAFEAAAGLPEDYRLGQSIRMGRLRPMRQWILAVHHGRWPRYLEDPLRAAEDELACRTPHRSMSMDELRRLASLPWVDVAVHTVTHPVLPLLSDDVLRHELESGYNLLREVIPDALPILAIPFGLFDARIVRTAREAGMRASLTLEGTTLRRARDRDFLPRLFGSHALRSWRFVLHASGIAEWLGGKGRTGPRFPALPSSTS